MLSALEAAISPPKECRLCSIASSAVRSPVWLTSTDHPIPVLGFDQCPALDRQPAIVEPKWVRVVVTLSTVRLGPAFDEYSHLANGCIRGRLISLAQGWVPMKLSNAL